MPFESENSDREIDHEKAGELLKPWMSEAYEKAKELFERNAINPEDFKGLLEYARDNIDEDIEEIEALKNKFETDDAKMVADILEGLILEKSDNLFGPDIEMVKTSDYDDIKNGTDLVLESKDEQHLAIAVDVTFGGGSVKKKLSRIKEEIDADKLRDIKYYETEIGELGAKKRRKLHGIPRVVIGVETNTVKDLSAAWVRGDDKFIGESEAQYALLEEMRLQLKTFAEYAEQVEQQEIAKKYYHALEIVKKIQETKKIPKGHSAWLEDRVLKGIKLNLANIFNLTEEQEAA